MIIQQLARVGYYHKDDMDEDIYEKLDQIIDEEYWVNYNPFLADTMKQNVDYYEDWDGNMLEVLHTWSLIGLNYPDEYLDAFLSLTSGYWFADDVTWAEVLGFGTEGRMGALYTYMYAISEAIPEGIPHYSKFPQLEHFLEKIVSGNAFYNWPVISAFFKPAFYCWMLLLNFIIFIYLKQRGKILIVIFPIVYLFTLFLGPVVNIRYVLPIIVSMPPLLGLWGDNIRLNDLRRSDLT